MLDYLPRSTWQTDNRRQHWPLGDVRRRDLRTWSALLSFRRRQDPSIPECSTSPDLPGTGGARHERALRKRSVDVAASRSPGRNPPQCPWTRKRTDDTLRLRDRIRLLSADAARHITAGQERPRALLCRTDQRHHRL